MISFIVPAHNEQECLPATLEAIGQAARECDAEHEVIVVDDASTDATAQVAKEHGARVISVKHRQIAATRNSGALAAKGDYFFFIDADTLANAVVLRAALSVLDRGAVGGGALTRFTGGAPLYARLLLLWLAVFQKLGGVSAGAFLFCTSEAFRAAGGFDERLFGGEDAAFSHALRREGRFVLLLRRVATSGRRVRRIHGLKLLGTLLRIALRPSTVASRENVQSVWYDSDRSQDESPLSSFAARVSNGAALLVMLGVALGPVIGLAPRPPFVSAAVWRVVALTSSAIRAHVGLILLPLGGLLVRNLFRRQTLGSWFATLALAAASLWLGWRALRGTLWFWSNLAVAIPQPG